MFSGFFGGPPLRPGGAPARGEAEKGPKMAKNGFRKNPENSGKIRKKTKKSGKCWGNPPYPLTAYPLRLAQSVDKKRFGQIKCIIITTIIVPIVQCSVTGHGGNGARPEFSGRRPGGGRAAAGRRPGGGRKFPGGGRKSPEKSG